MNGPVPPPRRHLQPHADVAERVLAPGDPGRALRIAQWLLDQPKMLNHHRGLWGYTGTAADGGALTVQSTGIGGPSAAIVVEELIGLGARRILRVGTCGALGDRADLGHVLVVREVIGEDGTSRALGAPERQAPDAALTDALATAAGAGGRPATVVSTDLFYEADAEATERRIAAGASGVDLETAAVFAAAARRGVAAGCVLAVTALLREAPAGRIGQDALLAAEEATGRMAAAALSRAP